MAINVRLQRLFDDKRSSYAILPHPDAYTAREVAHRVRVKSSQLAKVVVVRDKAGRDFMVVLPASRKLDLHALHTMTGRVGFQLENEQELKLLFPDCEVGAMPPFGFLYGLKTYVDPCLLKGDDIFFQAGNHHEVVLMRRNHFEVIARPFYAGACLHLQVDHHKGAVFGRQAVAHGSESGRSS